MQKTTLRGVYGLLAATAVLVTSCVRITHEIEPIEINLNVKLQKAEEDLDDLFSDIDAASSTR